MDRLSILFRLYYNKTASREEREELMGLLQEASPEALATLANLIRESGENLDSYESGLPADKAASILAAILGKSTVELQSTETPLRVHRIHFRKSRWWAAAAIFILFVTGSYFLFFNKAEKRTEIVDKPTVPDDVRPPATNRAMVTLADGRVVYLDSIGNGELAMENGVKLVKLADGRIVYEIAQVAPRNDPSTGPEQTVVWNTLSNPRGSRVIDMMLSDGTHVWLNAGSSVTYPVAFNGSERRVSVTGEAYFEVSSLPLSGGKKMPFIVSKGDIQVEVLGTHFNVNAYEDEADVKVTLLEGSVRTSIGLSTGSGGESSILKPGEQAVIRDRIKVVKGVDADEVMAWKNGRFVFGEKADIQTIMRQIARWYDVEVEYRGTIRNHFGGSISRQVNVSEVFRVLEATGGVKCKVEGRKVIVMP